MTPADLSLAFIAGALAAFNPCGFALLPAYLMAYINGTDSSAPTSTALRRAAGFAGGMGVGLVAVFALFALVLVPVQEIIERYLPIVTVIVGVALVVVGMVMLRGKEFGFAGMRIVRIAPGTSRWSVLGYGVTFALASLSCTIGPFLAVIAIGLSHPQWWATPVLLGVYTLGMSAIVLAAGVAVALAREGVLAKLSGFRSKSNKVVGWLVTLVGVYVAWYGIFDMRIRANGAATDPVVETALAAQSAVLRLIAESGTVGILAAALVSGAVLVGVLVWNRHRRQAGSTEHDHSLSESGHENSAK